MRKIILYYSITENTKLVCRSIQRKYADFDLVDMTSCKEVDLTKYDCIGIASSVYNLSLPPFVKEYLNKLESCEGKEAFGLITYSVMCGQSIKDLDQILKSKGFTFIGYHTLKMPDSFPPFIKKGITEKDSPNDSEVKELKEFIERVRTQVFNNSCKVKLGFWNSVIRAPSEKKIHKDFGTLYIDKQKCTGCEVCLKSCHYNAIKFLNHPNFDMDLCKSCYGCFNNCPEKAIYTDNVDITSVYDKSSLNLLAKFS